MEIYLTAIKVKIRMIEKSNLLLQKALLMTTIMLHNLVIQAMIMIVQVMAMKTPEPHPKRELINGWKKLYYQEVRRSLEQ